MGRNRSTNKAKPAMSLVHPNAAAIDIGATMHTAAVSADRTPEPVRSFGTFTADLHRLVDWFIECGVETVVMESTGVYWIPIFELLDTRGFAVFVVNARDAKHVPGCKTDVSDAQWLQRLHSYGLLSTSFRPKGRIAELRSYVRQRERLLEYAASHIQHMQKALMEMNLQVHHVVADITGSTGMRIIRAILAGERDPAVLAALRNSRCRADVETIEKALGGNYRAEHRVVVQQKRIGDFLTAPPVVQKHQGICASRHARGHRPFARQRDQLVAILFAEKAAQIMRTSESPNRKIQGFSTETSIVGHTYLGYNNAPEYRLHIGNIFWGPDQHQTTIWGSGVRSLRARHFSFQINDLRGRFRGPYSAQQNGRVCVAFLVARGIAFWLD